MNWAALPERPLESLDSIIEAAEEIRASGLQIVLVSMGCCGMLMISDAGRYLARPPEVEVKNTIGAGDSAVAGFIHGLMARKDLRDALKYSVASGTATILQTGTAVCRREDFLTLLDRVVLEEV